ncbi:GntR family transcriptional regulator [Xylanimonas ulmi]|uniref:GntR family transcriptional regulator n=1 Tax=Xylanimonas ulmi TaxID=228973 RepID=A0A4V2EXX4_9MICO|nr:GntR family transcriptional regulator [Xylanibacterium ulmi]RZS61000.1 GntR family transcriptional regulator [Xylanibacterium ulmi]
MTTPTQTTPLSKSERVYQTLRERISDGTYVGGFRLVLDQLARELDVSPVPVREAVRRLEAEGLVTFTRNVGAQVRGIDVHEYADTMQTLAYLEGAATSLALPHLDASHLERAQALHDQMRRLPDIGFDPVRFTELNEQFHRTLYSACPNKHLISMLEREWRRMALIRRSSFAAIPARSRESVAEHEHILTLLRAGAGRDEVERVVRCHTLRTRETYVAARATPVGA